MLYDIAACYCDSTCPCLALRHPLCALPPQDMLRKLSIVGAGTLLPMLVGAGDPGMRVFLVLVVALGWLVVQVRLQPYRLQEVRRGRALSII